MNKVLIADDEAPIREWLKNCVETADCAFNEVLLASNGREALEIVRSANPKVIITDINMPELNGIDFIKEIRALNEDAKIAILTCHSDFEFARSALKYGVMNYLLKNEVSREDIHNLLLHFEEELLSNTEGNQDILDYITQERFFKRIMHLSNDYQISEEELAANHIALKNAPFFAVAFNIHDEINLKEFHVDIRGLSNNQIFMRDFHNYFLFANMEDDVERYPIIIDEIKASLCAHSHHRVRIGYSNVYQDIDHFWRAVRESKRMCDYLFFERDLSAFDAEKNYIVGDLKLEIAKYRNNIIDAVKNLGKQASYSLVRELFDFIINQRFYDTDYIFGCFTEIIESSAKYVDMKDHKLTDIETELIRCRDIAALRKVVDDFYASIEDIPRYPKSIVSAISYINNNYHKQISLSDLAGKVNLSEEYLSRLFKKETGLNILEYINNTRLEKADKLIKTTDFNINEIGFMVGIPNSSYFSNIYKKKYGVSPSKIRDIADD